MADEFLSIGAFARAPGLSPRALRLYDDLGLLRPAAVDAGSGHRWYAPARLDRARLVAWLRPLDLPLARIRDLADRPGAELAAAVERHLGPVDAGELAAEDAPAHPQRALLVRALGATAEPDLAIRTALPGDRYLLCSDGLWAVVAAGRIGTVLAAGADPGETVRLLIAEAMAAGAPDNIACVVADVVPV